MSESAAALVDGLIRRLAAVIPALPAPELIAEDDGDYCIDWSVDATRIFSISVGAHGKINFAGQFGEHGSMHGWQCINDNLDVIVECLHRLYRQA